jgi:hypothetical protein
MAACPVNGDYCNDGVVDDPDGTHGWWFCSYPRGVELATGKPKRTTAMLFHGPVARSLMRARASRKLMDAGHTTAEVHHAFKLAGPDVYEAAFAAAGVNPMQNPPAGGEIIDAILAWLKSDQGQAVIAMLVKLLIAALVAA